MWPNAGPEFSEERRSRRISRAIGWAREPEGNGAFPARENIMKTENEIQMAHDRLKAIILDEVPNPFPGVDLRPVQDVLCWILGHEHNPNFAENLRKIDEFLAERGFKMRKTQ